MALFYYLGATGKPLAAKKECCSLWLVLCVHRLNSCVERTSVDALLRYLLLIRMFCGTQNFFRGATILMCVSVEHLDTNVYETL